MAVTKTLKSIEEDMFGKPLTSRERTEKHKELAKVMLEKLSSVTDSHVETLPTGAVKIIIHPSYVEDVAATLGESFFDFDLAVNTKLRKLGKTMEDIEPELIESWRAEQEAIRKAYIELSVRIFEERKKQIAKQVAIHFHELIWIDASIHINNFIQETFGTDGTKLTATDWKDNVVYGFSQRVKEFFGISHGGSKSDLTDEQCKEFAEIAKRVYPDWIDAKKLFRNPPRRRQTGVDAVLQAFQDLPQELVRTSIQSDKPSELALKHAAMLMEIEAHVDTLRDYFSKRANASFTDTNNLAVDEDRS